VAAAADPAASCWSHPLVPEPACPGSRGRIATAQG
jgi:hypothetical protein